MFPPVLEDVDEGVPDLSWRRERTGMVPVGPNCAVATERTIDCLGDANREALDPAPQRQMSFRFDEQVNVVVLNAVVKQAEASTRRAGECCSDGDEDVVPPERGKAAARPQRDVSRAVRVVRWPTLMPYVPAPGCGLPSCTFAHPTSARQEASIVDPTASC